MPRLYHLISGRRSGRLHHNPAFGDGAQENGTLLLSGLEAMGGFGPFAWIRQDRSGPEDWSVSRAALRYAAVMATPSITTPAVTYFHKATSSLRASATIATFRPRPPLWLARSWNQRVRAASG